MTGPSAHAALGASNAHRWMRCAGSVDAEAGHADRSSEAAEEGTRAHALAETWLRQYGEHGHVAFIQPRDVDSEMYESVRFYVQTVTAEFRRVRELDAGARLYVEQRIDLSPLNPPRPMFGTADVLIIAPAAKLVSVLDLKYGKGVAVYADDNPQLRYYAVGAWLHAGTLGMRGLHMVRSTIVQPRIADAHGDPRVLVCELDALDLAEFAAELIEAARRVVPGAPRTPGTWCRWCKASPTCRARLEHAQDVARVEFGTITLFEESTIAGMPMPPAELSPRELGVVLRAAPILKQWLDDVHDYAKAQLALDPAAVEGYTLKPGQQRRAWRDPALVATILRKKGFADLVDDKPVGIMELTRHAKTHDSQVLRDILAEHVELKTMADTLAPVEHVVQDGEPAPQLTPAQREFL